MVDRNKLEFYIQNKIEELEKIKGIIVLKQI